jgi:hypothetical protein
VVERCPRTATWVLAASRLSSLGLQVLPLSKESRLARGQSQTLVGVNQHQRQLKRSGMRGKKAEDAGAAF